MRSPRGSVRAGQGAQREEQHGRIGRVQKHVRQVEARGVELAARILPQGGVKLQRQPRQGMPVGHLELKRPAVPTALNP